jgi:flagellar FliJ protein
MGSRETLICLKRFQVNENRRKIAQIEGMIAEIERIVAELERAVKDEQNRAGIHDPTHIAYPTYAKAAMQRRENLKRSAEDFRVQLDDAKAALDESVEEMRKVELRGKREQALAEQGAGKRDEFDADELKNSVAPIA